MLKELEFDGAIATIAEVEVDKKLGVAKVRLSVLPTSAAKKSLAVAERAAGELQHLLMKRIQIKPMPRIRFELDLGPQHASDVERLLLNQ